MFPSFTEIPDVFYQLEQYTETADEIDPDNERKSVGLSSKVIAEELSDEETSEANTQQSQGSLFNPEDFSQEIDSQNGKEENNSPLKSLSAFLAAVNMSPVQKIRDSFSNAEEKELYKNLVSKEAVVDEDLEEAIKQAYENSDTWTLQRQILSVIATKKSYKIAKRHGLKYGVGCPIPSDSKYQQSAEPEKIESFVDFITPSEVIKDMAFGEKKMKLSSGKIIPPPNVIRCITPAAILRQYDQYCEENDIEK
ncbi:unnamed protein product [Mytilus coruscus]|uniref:Uncharacterized protein n=1 Tax=Mytilus coruscus TaxID=42192 RepID=A0A6J8A6N0_MYTCO|nr:unnamed protein product [Mytilus coruscus]